MTLSLNDANRIAEGAIEKAKEINIRISVAICDIDGRLMLLKRMDGGIWAANWGCIAKATGIAAFGAHAPGSDESTRSHILKIMENSGEGHMFVHPEGGGGGVPIYRNDVLIGGCGVGGGSGEEDDLCSRAGVAQL